MGNINFNRDSHKENYTCINNAVLQNTELSFKAKGLFCYILSLKDNWVLFKSELSNRSTDGRTSIESAFKELENEGFIKTFQKPGGDLEFVVTEKPSVQVSFSDVENKHTLCLKSTPNPAQNQQLTNTNLNTDLLTTKKVSSSLSKEEIELKDYLQEIYEFSFSDDFYSKVVDVCCEKKVDAKSYLDWFFESKRNICSNLQNYAYKTAVLPGVVDEYKSEKENEKPHSVYKTRICKGCGRTLTNVDLNMGECTCGKVLKDLSDYEEVLGGQNE